MQNLTPEYLAQCRNALNTEQTKSLLETDNWSHVNKQQVHMDWDVLYKRLATMLEGSPASSPAIQEIMAQHYAIASRFYVSSREAYIGMGLFYHDNKDMKDFHNSYHPNMVEFLGEAIYVYAQRNL
jgi:TipAS antibiotic-recognition domain